MQLPPLSLLNNLAISIWNTHSCHFLIIVYHVTKNFFSVGQQNKPWEPAEVKFITIHAHGVWCVCNKLLSPSINSCNIDPRGSVYRVFCLSGLWYWSLPIIFLIIWELVVSANCLHPICHRGCYIYNCVISLKSPWEYHHNFMWFCVLYMLNHNINTAHVSKYDKDRIWEKTKSILHTWRDCGQIKFRECLHLVLNRFSKFAKNIEIKRPVYRNII